MIAEDDELTRVGLEIVLQRAGHEVVAAVADAEELVRPTRGLRPELVVTDIRMPPGYSDEGLRAALELRRVRPALPIVILSQHVERRYALELMESGAAGIGYLLKQRIADSGAFLADVGRVCSGGTVLDPEVAQKLISRAERGDPTVHALTERQREVLTLMAEGRTNAAIAERLTISEKSVVRHVSRIYDQLGLQASVEDHRRVLAVVRHLAAADGT